MPPGRAASKPENGNALRRGAACLCCRKRKLKCDGTRPVCRQCSKMGRADECEYDDRAQKSRTQKLKEKLAFLETRLRQLEAQDNAAIDPPSTPGTSSVDGAANASEPGLELVQLNYRPSSSSTPRSGLPTLTRSTPSADSIASPSASVDCVQQLTPPPSLTPYSTEIEVTGPLVLPPAISFDPASLAFAWLANEMSAAPRPPYPETTPRSLPACLSVDFPFDAESSTREDADHAHCSGADALMPYFEEPSGPEYRISSETTADGTSANSGSTFSTRAGVEYGYENQAPRISGDPLQNLSFETKRLLLASFAAHRHQCWFDGDITRFDPSHLDRQSSETPHPALSTAVYLLGCAFASASTNVTLPSPVAPSQLEVQLLAQAQREVHRALAGADRLVDVVRASALVAAYLYAHGRTLEGYTHAFASARLAAGLGLHRMQPAENSGASNAVKDLGRIATAVPLERPKGVTEWRERVSAFWQAFAIDRCWSVALGLPVGLPHGETACERIVTPWLTPAPPEASFLGVHPDPYMPTLKAKAVAFYERTSKLGTGDPAAIQSIVAALHAFIEILPPFRGREPWRGAPPCVDPDILLVHTLVHVSVIQVYNSCAPKPNLASSTSESLSYSNAGTAPKGCSPPSQQPSSVASALVSAQAIVDIAAQVGDSDFLFLDPILSMCWGRAATACCLALEHDVASVGARKVLPVETTEFWDKAAEQSLDLLICVLRKLSACFPVGQGYLQSAERQRTQTQACLAAAGQAIETEQKLTTVKAMSKSISLSTDTVIQHVAEAQSAVDLSGESMNAGSGWGVMEMVLLDGDDMNTECGEDVGNWGMATPWDMLSYAESWNFSERWDIPTPIS